MPTQTWLSKKKFVLIIALSKEKKNQTNKQKRSASLFSREKWMFVRILPFIRFFFKDLKTWSNMIGLVWYVISNKLTLGKFRLVCSFLFFLYLLKQVLALLLLLYHRIEKAWQIKLGLRFHSLTNHVLIFCFEAVFSVNTQHQPKSCGLILCLVALTRFSCYELQFLVKWNTGRDYEYLASSSMVCLLSSM